MPSIPSLAAALLAVLLLLPIPARAGGLAAGPMAGVAAMRSATVWLQGNAADEARIEFRPEAGGPTRLTDAVRLDPARDYVATLTLPDLAPGTTYRYRVLLGGKPAAGGRDWTLRTPPLWQWRTDPPAFKVLLGSCAYINDPPYDRPGEPFGGGYGIFASMTAQQPDLTLWLGDTLYFREVDYDSPAGMAARWRHARGFPELQSLLHTGQHAAIWDDHEYGPNDANRSFVFKDAALELFRRYWPNPSAGLPDVPGIFTVVKFGDADFFLLDDRWYRDADTLKPAPGATKQLYGEAQLRWLQNALLNSTAPFKFIAGGSQFFNNFGEKEGWHHFPEEREAFVAWLTANRVSGVVFLSGDRHHTELLKRERETGYPLLELTCSALTSRAHRPGAAEQAKPELVPGTQVGENNFCSLEFSGPRKARQFRIRTFNAAGEPLWERTVGADALRHRP